MANQVEVGIEVILHATEDSIKVFEPIFEIFGIKREEFTEEKIEGHHGNPILLFRAAISKRRAEEFVRTLVSKTSPAQIEEVLDNLEMYFEDSSLFLRIGKGEIVNKVISLQQNNAIKIRIKVPIYKKDQIVRTYTELLRR
ncbi:MAG TPA: RNA-binding domain-containing protein [Candidatus Nitrosotalea sp.]|nr:RNA-binding domain-containing protein [Candidatus Nitrosotalea sp.]